MKLTKERIIDICYYDLKPLWADISTDFPNYLDTVPQEVRALNVDFAEKTAKIMTGHFNKINSKWAKWFAFYRRRWVKKTEKLFSQYLQEEDILHISDYISPEAISGISEDLKIFISAAKQFELTVADLGQAVRNYLIYALILEASNKKQRYTPAIFGYSMLYPVTDNYIDGGFSDNEKRSFNKMIHDKLCGLPVSPPTARERQTCALLDCIESVYPRNEQNEIYLLLSLMLEAQQGSLVQQNKRNMLTEEKLIAISLYKGGVSVLIDRYIADARINDRELRFYLGYGFILQLADDLQDISVDLREGNQTLFTLGSGSKTPEKVVNQLLHFTDRLFSEHELPNEEFQIFMRQSTVYLILMSANMSREHFSESYLKTLEQHCPVSFSFLERYIKGPNNPKVMDEKDVIKALEMFL